MINPNLIACLTVVCAALGLSCLPLHAAAWRSQQGLASWYGKGFHGRQTASGERFSEDEMTAAHRKLPLGTKVMVENLDTGEQIELKINDRGPYVDTARRIIDLSRAAADRIGLVERGVGPVRVVVTEPAPKPQTSGEDVAFAIQVGAFVKPERAQRLVVQLQQYYPHGYVEPREGPRGRYYRARLGLFKTAAQAKQMASLLTQKGYCVFIDVVSERSARRTRRYKAHP